MGVTTRFLRFVTRGGLIADANGNLFGTTEYGEAHRSAGADAAELDLWPLKFT